MKRAIAWVIYILGNVVRVVWVVGAVAFAFLVAAWVFRIVADAINGNPRPLYGVLAIGVGVALFAACFMA
jgi:hypothetical protein